MIELLELSLGAAVCWETLRYLTPRQINVRLAPFIVAAMAFGLSFIPQESHILIALASAGGVAIFNRVTNAADRAPGLISIPRRTEKSRIPTSRRIP